MNIKETHQWLEEHVEEIFSFMDYEPTIDSEKDFASTMHAWFNNPDWNDGSYRFVHLGIDGTGSQLAAWFATHDAPPHVVFFGSEGGCGVLTKNLEDWVKALAHAPFIKEYPSSNDDAPSRLESSGNWRLDKEEAKAALSSYRTAVIERWGALPELSVLTSGLDSLNEVFLSWVFSRTTV